MTVWKSSDPETVISTTPLHQKFFEAMEKTIAKDPQHVAFIKAEKLDCKTKTSDLLKLSKQAAVFLNKIGFKAGDVATSFAPNTVEHVSYILGVMTSGGVMATTNYTFTTEEVNFRLNDCEASLILTEEDRLQMVLEACKGTKVKKVICVRQSNQPLPKDVIDYEEVTKVDSDLTHIVTNYNPDSVVFIPYSSGTTGRGKAILFSHKNLGTTLDSMCWHSKKWDETMGNESDLIFVQQPLYHMSGFLVTFQGILNGRTGIHLRTFDFPLFLQTIQTFKFMWVSANPMLLRLLTKHPIVPKFDLNSLRIAFCTSAPLGKTLALEFLNKFPQVKILQGYGMSETGMMSHCPDFDQSRDDYMSCGSVCSSFECKIMDSETGDELGINEAGEIVVRGPTVMLGYKDAEATRKAILDGWLYSGDAGYVDEKGRLFSVERVSDLIPVGEYKVSPSEIEDELMAHPQIMDVGVMGAPISEGKEQAPFAFIVRKVETLTEADVHDFLKCRLADHKHLSGGIEFVDKIPRTSTGKIIKKQLIEMFEKVLVYSRVTCPRIIPRPISGLAKLNSSFYSRSFHSTRRSLIWRSNDPDTPISTTPVHEKIFQAMRKTIAENPNHIAFVKAEDLTSKASTKDLLKLSMQTAVYLNKIGFKAGEVDTCFLPNTIEHIATILGTLACGGVVSPSNYAFTPEEASNKLIDSGATVIIAEEPKIGDIIKACKNTAVKHILCVRQSDEPLPKGVIDFQEVTKENSDLSHIKFDYDSESVALMPFSSGTTGRAKAILLSHKAMSTSLDSMSWHSQKWDEVMGNKSENIFVQQPLAHMSGFLVTFQGILNGKTEIQMKQFDLFVLLQNIQKFKFMWLSVNPALLRVLAKHPVVEKFDLSSLRIVFCAAAPLGKNLAKEFMKKFPNVKIMQGFAMTETGMTSHCPDFNQSKEDFMTCGSPCSTFECKIIDPKTGEELGPNQVGEILIRGPMMMAGYKLAGETEPKLKDGWLHSGDAGRVDEKGRLYVVDRMSEILMVDGKAVSAPEIEDELLAHPLISDVGILGFPSSNGKDKAPFAFIVKKDDSLKEEDVHKFLKERLEPHKKLAGIHFIEQIPRTPAGKVVRVKLREINDKLKK
ncbi:unnamed protein product [Caenorhabditis auriculariae]|uniref:4-coumarate--CoA ligase n=1 Tax=Caenorhabditis auriculariae TaxID=2777116 RepID=A0A8S1HJ49_9PELO|nr:unnamed protein product [Caenorhabditis auriculariae]